MTDDKDRPKPVTLEDYIPPTPPPSRSSKRAARERLTEDDRRRLEALERETRKDDDAPKSGKRPKKSKFWTFVIWAAIIIMIANLLD